jgi:hypothetical protein
MATVQERSFVDRLIGVAKLDAATFEEIEHDETATVWAAVIATLAGVSLGVGIAMLGIALGEVAGWGAVIFFGIVYAILGLLGLALFTTVAYLVGGNLLKTEATEVTWAQLFRTLGFAGLPIVVLGWLAMIHSLVLLVAIAWFLGAVVVAVRQAMDFGTDRAVVTALVAFIVTLIPIVAMILTAPPV